MTAVSDEYLLYFTITLQSIIERSVKTSFYDIVVLGSKLSYHGMERLKLLITDQKNFCIRFIDVSDTLSKYNLPIEQVYKPIIYARLLIPELLHHYSRAIYIDADIVLCDDIAKLYHYPFDENLLLAVKDTGMIAWYHMPNSKEKKYIDKELKLKYPDCYFNSGLIVFNIPKFGKEYQSDFLLQYAESKQWRWRDQDVFMTLCDGRIGLLPQEWNVLLPYFRNDMQMLLQAEQFELAKKYQTALAQPKVLHFIGTSFLYLEAPPIYAEQFWKLARKMEIYEMLLQRAFLFTVRKGPESVKCFSKFSFESRERVLQETLDLFEDGELGFRYIIKCIKGWLSFKLFKTKSCRKKEK